MLSEEMRGASRLAAEFQCEGMVVGRRGGSHGARIVKTISEAIPGRLSGKVWFRIKFLYVN